jgi:erythrocyte band 7 integral membrane protein
LGRILKGGAKGPGLFFILPCVDKCIKCDLRTITFDVAPQELLTKDSVTVTVDAVCYLKIVNPVSSVTNVTNSQFSTRSLAATTLRNILGTKTLQELLQDKESIAHHMQEILDNATELWGIKVERVELYE